MNREVNRRWRSLLEKIPIGFWLGILPFASSIQRFGHRKTLLKKRSRCDQKFTCLKERFRTRLDRWEVNNWWLNQIVSNLLRYCQVISTERHQNVVGWPSTVAGSNRWSRWRLRHHRVKCRCRKSRKTQEKLTAGTSKSPKGKGKSFEPSLHFWVRHVNFPGCSWFY